MNERRHFVSDELFKGLEERTGKHPKCPMCTSDEWHRIGGGWVVELRLIQKVDPASSGVAQWHTAAIALSCTNCGFLRLHEAAPDNWGEVGADLP